MNLFISKLKKLVEKQINENFEKDRFSGKEFYRFENDKNITYSFTKHPHFLESDVSIMEMEYESYLSGNLNKPVLINLNSKSKHKMIIKSLMQLELTQDVFDKIFDTILLNVNKLDYLEFFKLAEDRKSTLHSKPVILKILKAIEDKIYTYPKKSDFDPAVKALREFKFSRDEHHLVKGFFDFYQKLITSEPHVTEYDTISFLKKSIEPEYWHEFSQYCINNPGLKKITKLDGSYMQDNFNPVYTIDINTDFIRVKHLVLSTSSDMRTAIKDILDTFTRNGKILNIEKGFMSVHQDKFSSIHFQSQNLNLLDTQRIKDIFDILLDKYVEQFKISSIVKHAFMDKVFEYAFIESALGDNKAISKKLKYENKI